MSDESISEWIDDLKAGNESAVQHVWERYFEQLVVLARRKLGTVPRRLADEEDIAISAFDSFCRHAAAGRFPKLQDRDDLWKLLFTVTERKATAQIKYELRQKRGGGRQEVSFHDSNGDDHVERQPAAPEPSPDFALQLAEEMQRLLERLQDATLSQVAVMKMEGYSNAEIASSLELSNRTIIRKLKVIRSIWSQ